MVCSNHLTPLSTDCGHTLAALVSSMDEGDLQYLVTLLQQVALGDASAQAHTTQQLMHFTATPSSFYCLGHVFLDDSPSPPHLLHLNPMLVEAVRGMSGLVLKNWIKQNRRDFGPDKILFIREGLVRALRSPLGMIRSTAGSVLTTIVSVTGGSVLEDGTGCWPSMLADLCAVATPAAYEAIEKIVEDNVECLVHGHAYIADELVAHLIAVLCESTEEPALNRAITALCQFVPYGLQSLGRNLSRVMEGLSRTGDRPSLQRTICQTLNSLMCYYTDDMLRYVPSLLQYTFAVMGQGESSRDSSAALEATEFWLTLADLGSLSLSESELRAVVACLLRNMRYADDAPELAEQDCSIEDGQDRDTDIMPRHHRAKEEPGELDDEDEQAGDKGQEGDYDWSLRKCSAATLDCISNCPSLNLLPALLPQVQALFSSSDWKDVEVAVLALGAVAEGQRDAMEQHLDSLLPFLLNQMKGHGKPLIRTISTWAISRYSWFLSAPRHQTRLGQPVMEGVLYGMISPNKLVQKASCTALVKYIECAEALVMRVLPALDHAVKCALKTYHRKNLVLLYELLRTLADTFGNQLGGTINPDILLELMAHWEGTKTEDSAMFPLLEAMASLALAVGSAFGAIANVALDRSLAMIDAILIEATRQRDSIEDEQYDMAIVAMDLIGGLTCGLGATPEMQHLLESRAFALQSIIVRGLHEPVTQVRQSVFALIGDLASHSCSHVLKEEACLSIIKPAILQNLKPSDEISTATASNAVWSAGELALALHSPLLTDMMEPMLPMLLEVLSYEERRQQMRAPSLHGYLDNVVVCVGRLIGVLTSVPTLKSHVPALVESFPFGIWCQRVSSMPNPSERPSCLIPICTLISESSIALSRTQAQSLSKMVSALQTQLEPSDDLVLHLASLSARIASQHPNLSY